MRRHAVHVLGQLSLDDVPQATGRRTLTPAERLRAAELRARQAHRRAGRRWHEIATAFFGGLG
ncbi:hypothetical protein C0216_08820 [Streptomyces globosus]|uniref:Uncharacterized protein n=1 Tax=Streptomyces globosus TaxID=68209 RepID=A0A344TY30_9ACTN|nr:hypothetical protein [Streptomyces globosus]AXE23551.1 hypothetical protein C0216_08820 [Streptomyces globosus]